MAKAKKTAGGQSTAAGRLAALRAQLEAARLDGFIVPHADEHQNEFLPPRAERLAWLHRKESAPTTWS